MEGWLLHGWGFQRSVFNKIRKTTVYSCPSTTPDLYSIASSLSDYRYSAMADALTAECQRKTIAIGWSMGGQIAIELAAKSQNISALVLIASAPKMVNSQDWDNTISEDAFSELQQIASQDVNQALKKLASLSAHGESNARKSMLEINSHINNHKNHDILNVWLEEMRVCDLRQTFSNLNIPVLVVLAENDALINVKLKNQLKQLLPSVEIQTIPEAGHAIVISQAKRCAESILGFINDIN